MTKEELIEEINAELSGTCSLPIKVNAREMARIIDRAARWFYNNYRDAVETDHFVIPIAVFQSPEFRACRTVKLPDCVVSVTECKEIRGAEGLLGDFKSLTQRMVASELYFGGGMGGNMGEGLVNLTARMSFYDLTQAFFLEVVRYDWNRNSKNVKFTGRNPETDVYLQTYVKIPEEKLYEDEYFIEYVAGKALIAQGNIFSTFEYKLPGGITINGSNLVTQGQERVEKILERINDENSPDWFYIFH